MMVTTVMEAAMMTVAAMMKSAMMHCRTRPDAAPSETATVMRTCKASTHAGYCCECHYH